MCLAKPLKLTAIDPGGHQGRVSMSDGELTVGLLLVPEAKVGDFVLVHAGAAIEVLGREDAEAILDAYEEFAHLDGSIAPDDQPTRDG